MKKVYFYFTTITRSRNNPGWRGARCNSDINECLTRNYNSAFTYLPHTNGICNMQWTLQCINLPGSFKCDCKAGIRGLTCNEDVNECRLNNGMGPCYVANTKSCQNQFGSYSRTCKPGFKGKNCDVDDYICKNCNPSHTNHCDVIDNNYFCYCKSGNAAAVVIIILYHNHRRHHHYHHYHHHRAGTGGRGSEANHWRYFRFSLGWKGKRCGEDVNECVERSGFDRRYVFLPIFAPISFLLSISGFLDSGPVGGDDLQK